MFRDHYDARLTAAGWKQTFEVRKHILQLKMPFVVDVRSHFSPQMYSDVDCCSLLSHLPCRDVWKRRRESLDTRRKAKGASC